MTFSQIYRARLSTAPFRGEADANRAMPFAADSFAETSVHSRTACDNCVRACVRAFARVCVSVKAHENLCFHRIANVFSHLCVYKSDPAGSPDKSAHACSVGEQREDALSSIPSCVGVLVCCCPKQGWKLCVCACVRGL